MSDEVIVSRRKHVAVVGSRDFPKPALVVAFCLALPRDVLIVTGDCPTGADEAARRAIDLRQQHMHRFVFFADWRTHGKKAGPLRNQALVDSLAPEQDELIAFACSVEAVTRDKPVNRGTRDVSDRAKKRGIPVTTIYPTATEDAVRALAAIAGGVP